MSKATLPDSVHIEQLPDGAQPPMDLLLLADPHAEEIRKYIHHCILLVALDRQETVGVLALSPESRTIAEIRNIAVRPGWRGKGIARKLLQEATERAHRLGYTTLQVCTANSSIRPFQVYQQFGFELTDVKWDYFSQHYPEPIVEDGIPCRHQLVLTKKLD